MRHALLTLTALTLTLAACQSQPQLIRSTPAINPAIQAQSVNAIDDSDLSGGFRPQVAAQVEREAIGSFQDRQVYATRQIASPASRGNGLSGALTYADQHGAIRPAGLATVSLYAKGSERALAQTQTNPQGQWEFALPAAGQYQVRYTLENKYWNIRNYVWDGPAVEVSSAGAPVQTGTTQLAPGTENAKAAWIHEVFIKSLSLFDREQVSLEWWKQPIQAIWPGRANYYTNYTVNLTGAEQWDVNGHEIGHAIYHQALNARSRGGQHKIDDCYHGTLALSEGFASFFSAAVHLPKNDPDARFDQYLVPRRAPIRIENVPDDVCPGSTNEWRVSSVFWDLYDTHADGQDNLNLGLKTIFEALGRSSRPTAESALDAYQLLKEVVPAAQHAQVDTIFKQNTMEIQ